MASAFALAIISGSFFFYLSLKMAAAIFKLAFTGYAYEKRPLHVFRATVFFMQFLPQSNHFDDALRLIAGKLQMAL